MEISFERFENGRWYVVFPEYEGDQEDLEMVEGADKMLDALSSDGLYSTLNVELEEPDGGVVHEFFGNHPERIYCSLIE